MRIFIILITILVAGCASNPRYLADETLSKTGVIIGPFYKDSGVFGRSHFNIQLLGIDGENFKAPDGSEGFKVVEYVAPGKHTAKVWMKQWIDESGAKGILGRTLLVAEQQSAQQHARESIETIEFNVEVGKVYIVRAHLDDTLEGSIASNSAEVTYSVHEYKWNRTDIVPTLDSHEIRELKN
jgi:hypothetical protein